MEEKNNLFRSVTVFLSLIKYRLSLAVTLSAVTGYFLYTGTPGTDLLLLVPGIFFIAAGSAVLNQYTEKDQDALMPRTKERPLVSEKVTPVRAIVILSVLLISGSCILLLCGLLPFVLGCLGVILYNFVYTRLKKVTLLAIVPGAIVGAVPPLIGFTSAGGSFLNERIIFFSSFMFLWQIPHFLLLLIRYGKEYQAAGFRTAYDHLNEKQIKYLVLVWILLSSATIWLIFMANDKIGKGFSFVFAVITILYVVLLFISFFGGRKPRKIKSAFTLLNLYGFVIMTTLIGFSVSGGF